MVIDDKFLLAVSFFSLLALFLYLRMPQRLLAILDSRTFEIHRELKRAKELCAEADRLLTEYKEREGEAEKALDEILAKAQRDADALAAEGEQEMKEQLARRTAESEAKIARAEALMIQEVREAIIDMAVTASAKVVNKTLTAEQAAKIVDAAISHLNEDLH